MTTYKYIIYSLLSLYLTSSCAPKVKDGYDEKNGYIGNISISGAFALYPITVLWAEAFKKENPNVRFNISAGGAGKGIADVLSNMADIGLLSRDLHEQESQQGAFPIPVAKDAVIAVINSQHPNYQLLEQRGLSQDELQGIFVDKRYKLWSDIDPRLEQQPIETYVRSDAAGAAETWANFLGTHQEGLQGIGIFGDPGLVQAIKASPLSIGFSNINFVYDLKSKHSTTDIAALPLDINSNGHIDPNESFYQHLDSLTEAIAANRYPEPPARNLSFVIQADRNSKLLTAFLRFALAEEQQAQLLSNGYVPLNQKQRTEALNKLR